MSESALLPHEIEGLKKSVDKFCTRCALESIYAANHMLDREGVYFNKVKLKLIHRPEEESIRLGESVYKDFKITETYECPYCCQRYQFSVRIK